MTDLQSPHCIRHYRLTNIDMLRGLVIVLMALDHVRDFFMMNGAMDPTSQTDVSAPLFLTRWVTHFCAPVFVFLAGTSAGLMSSRKTNKELGSFLLKRGLWLIFIEVTVISTAWTFAPFEGVPEVGGATIFAMQVIWVIGASMVALAGFQYLGTRACLAIGAAILLGHNALDPIWPTGNLFSGNDPLWYGLHSQSSTTVGPVILLFVYPLLPWIGVMLLGYGTVYIFKKKPSERDQYLLRAGVLMVFAFVAIRLTGLYGDPNSWAVQSAGVQAILFDFINLTKYPPSLLFLLATLGPMAVVCAYADRMRGWLKDTLVMFGRVPFAFYVAHLYLIRAMNLALASYEGIDVEDMMTFVFFLPKEDFGVSLGWIYAIWILVLAILYPFCRWMADLKSRRKDWWLSYL